jgi:hypothetical protein
MRKWILTPLALFGFGIVQTAIALSTSTSNPTQSPTIAPSSPVYAADSDGSPYPPKPGC